MVVAPLDICLDSTALRVDYNIFNQNATKNLAFETIADANVEIKDQTASPSAKEAGGTRHLL